MAIKESNFDNEKELDSWVQQNLHTFLPGAIFLAPFQIRTTSGKRGLPDGFAYNLLGGEWFVIEADLLSHGVWPHIAEQITRYVVAVQNPETRRKIRDNIFESIIENNFIDEACNLLNTNKERLLQKLEVFVEGIEPQVLIFMDDTNQDLYDMAHALSMNVKIFRVKKFIVNGKVEYHSPDQNIPVLATDQTEESRGGISDFNVVESLGGGELDRSISRFKSYRMFDNSTIHVKRSKFHPKHDYYWYGITPIALENCKENNVSHIVFIMGEEGFVKVPVEVIEKFVENTRTSNNEDGSVRHYHILISPSPDPELYYSNEIPRIDVSQYFQAI